MNIVGIDPSLTGTGIATPIGVSTVKTKGTGDDRLAVIHAAVTDAVMWSDLAVVEDLPVHAKSAGKTGMAQGVVRLALVQARIPFVTVTAASLKKFATGKGNADKIAMATEALKRGGMEFKDDNECDAWWLRCMGLSWTGWLPFTLPQTHLDALAKVEWPTLGEAA